jgi:hypothetical protein
MKYLIRQRGRSDEGVKKSGRKIGLSVTEI